MRSAIIVGAATLALGSMLTPASAGAFWFLGKTIKECVHYGVVEKDVPQVQCASNFVDRHGHSNDGNTQRIRQRQEGTIREVDDTLQLQIGSNYVKEGDDNYQKIKQYQNYDGPDEDEDDIQQLQVGSNVVLDGDNNSQTIKQSQTLNVSDPS
jgi:hypothetical protein